jgi:hypothetical protein
MPDRLQLTGVRRKVSKWCTVGCEARLCIGAELGWEARGYFG